MQSARVVEGLDVVERHHVGFVARRGLPSVEDFSFVSGEEALLCSVVIAVSLSAHAGFSGTIFGDGWRFP